jgi:hypothetical protein
MVFIAALLLTGATAVFCYLTVIAGAEPKCAGRVWPEGHRPTDFLALPLVAGFITALIWLAAKELPPR